jgi:RTX calcium-binding nonapeptide repeat (4 copies)
MKKALLIAMLILAAQAPTLAHADPMVNVLLAGGSEPNMISVKLTPDGVSYVIDSIVPLEVGGTVCTNPPDVPNELICQASAVASIEVNAGGGNDRITVGPTVPIPVTVRGGYGRDLLVGGSGDDRLLGGPGADRLVGRAGNDYIAGSFGDDRLIGGPGDDELLGGPGDDSLLEGSGANKIRQ